MLPIVFRKRARDDLAAAHDWYEERASLGEGFLSAVQSSLNTAALYPDLFSVVHNGVRRAIVSRFPFGIFYVVEPQRIVVLRILHTARDPNLWPQGAKRSKR